MICEMNVGCAQEMFAEMSSLTSSITTPIAEQVMPPPCMSIRAPAYSRTSAITSVSVLPFWRSSAPARTAESSAYWTFSFCEIVKRRSIAKPASPMIATMIRAISTMMLPPVSC